MRTGEMKTCVFIAFFGLVSALFADAPAAVRNPFWPIGYKGVSTPISAEARKKPAPPPSEAEKESAKSAKTAAEAAMEQAEADARQKAADEESVREKAKREAAFKAVITDDDWEKAVASLKISMPAVFTGADGAKRYSVNINGKIYADGDFMSCTHNNTRFTWKVQNLQKGSKSLKLHRVRAYRIPDARNGESK